MKHNVWNYIYFLVALPFLVRFFDFSSSGNPSYLVTGSMGIVMILLIFREYKRFNKIFFLTLIGLIVISGLIFICTYLFKYIYIFSNEYYYAIGTFSIYTIFFVWSYHRREVPRFFFGESFK